MQEEEQNKERNKEQRKLGRGRGGEGRSEVDELKRKRNSRKKVTLFEWHIERETTFPLGKEVDQRFSWMTKPDIAINHGAGIGFFFFFYLQSIFHIYHISDYSGLFHSMQHFRLTIPTIQKDGFSLFAKKSLNQIPFLFFMMTHSVIPWIAPQDPHISSCCCCLDVCHHWNFGNTYTRRHTWCVSGVSVWFGIIRVSSIVQYEENLFAWPNFSSMLLMKSVRFCRWTTFNVLLPDGRGVLQVLRLA